MARSLRDEVEKLISQQGLRAIVLHASGRAFCGGGDVASFVKSGIDNACSVIDDLLEALHPTVLALRQTPAPVITAVHGVAAGAGLSLALAGDLIVATEDSKFLVAYERLGAPPDCGLSWFVRHQSP